MDRIDMIESIVNFCNYYTREELQALDDYSLETKYKYFLNGILINKS